MAVFTIYNPDGSVQFNMGNRLSRIIGQQQVSGNGSYAIPVTPGSSCWAWLAVSTGAFAYGTTSISDNVVTWSIPPGQVATLVYGEY